MAFGDPYVSRAEMKVHLGIEDDADNARVDDAILGAAQETEDYCSRQFNTSTTTYTRVYSVKPNSRVAVIDDFHSVTDLVVKVGSLTSGFTDTWTINTDFLVSPVNSTRNERPGDPFWRIETMLNQRFPHAVQDGYNLQVASPNWGWAAVPPNVVQANKILASRLFRRRDSPDGVLGGFEGSPIRVGWMMDPDAERLLKRFRKHVEGRF